MSSLERRPWEDLAEAVVAQAVEDYRMLKQGKPIVSVPKEKQVIINGEKATVRIPRREWLENCERSIRRSMREIEIFFKSDLFKSMCGEIDGKDVIKRLKAMDVGGKNKKKERPACQFRNAECYAYMKDGTCFCLEDTNFVSDECPFFKREEDVSKMIMLQKEKEEADDE